ncbi:hypothetical protein J6836_00805 [Providencia sp. R33]|uniref:hypothetical protein n=1 Tax=Providencia sp. R33 TaxID=2828763 RepID=UPI001C5A5FB6|nr:hypothetical protein [Providencia sp. R33]QXX82967.1 hypothetical protein J6836_00805 [Providencia sp. R33]
MKTLKEIVYRIAMHEAGHWISWRAKGGTSEGIEVQVFSVTGRYTGASMPILKWEIDNLGDVEEYLRARMITLLSGVYAEAFDGDNLKAEVIDKEFSPSGSSWVDYLKVIDELNLYCCIKKSHDLKSKIGAEVEQEAATIIASNYELIKRIAMKFSDMAEFEGQKLFLSEMELVSIISNKGGAYE